MSGHPDQASVRREIENADEYAPPVRNIWEVGSGYPPFSSSIGRKSRNNAHHFLSSKVLVLLGATASLRLPHFLSRTRLRLRKQARMSLKIFTVVSASVFDTRSNPTYEEPHEFQTSPANHRKQRRGSQACRFSARNFR